MFFSSTSSWLWIHCFQTCSQQTVENLLECWVWFTSLISMLYHQPSEKKHKKNTSAFFAARPSRAYLSKSTFEVSWVRIKLALVELWAMPKLDWIWHLVPKKNLQKMGWNLKPPTSNRVAQNCLTKFKSWLGWSVCCDSNLIMTYLANG